MITRSRIGMWYGAKMKQRQESLEVRGSKKSEARLLVMCRTDIQLQATENDYSGLHE